MTPLTIDGRYTVAGWLEQARLCWRDKRPDLVPVCLTEAAARAAEGDESLADYLERSEPTWTS